MTSHPAPNWDLIFERRPDLQPPGYMEAVEAVFNEKNKKESERVRFLAQQIAKEKTSHKNKTRNSRKSIK